MRKPLQALEAAPGARGPRGLRWRGERAMEEMGTERKAAGSLSEMSP